MLRATESSGNELEPSPPTARGVPEAVPPATGRSREASSRGGPLQLEPESTKPRVAASPGGRSLRRELEAMKLSQIRKRAAAQTVDEDAIDEAADGDDEKAALIELILQTDLTSSDPSGLTELRAELSAMKMSQLRKRSAADGVDEEAIDEAADGEDEKGKLIELLLLAHQPPVDDHGAELREELSILKPSQLRKRAAADNVESEAMEDAANGDDESTALIELIVQAETAGRSTPAGGSAHSRSFAQHAVRQELQSLKISALKKRAAVAGVSEEALEEAEDEDDYKSAVIELIVQADLSGEAGAALSLIKPSYVLSSELSS